MFASFIHQAKVIVFDMDGTLYEGTGHFQLFAENMKNLLTSSQQSDFMKMYESFRAGKSPLKIGSVYDAKEDVIWKWDPFTQTLTGASDWNHNTVNITDAPEKLSVEEFDFKRWVPIGDGWWPPFVIARHFGLTNKDTGVAYHLTKEQMAEKDDYLKPTPGLKEFLESIVPFKKLVLMTNSEQDDAERILAQLGLDHLFDDRITSAYKPVKTKEHLQRVMEVYQVNSDEVLSIGDNFMNEVAPALQLDMRAVWITGSNQKPVDDPRYIKIPTLENAHQKMK
ncbi:MAG: HAD family hydrolase [Bacillaceae bacterium]|nr:HAD family hydrolase [Bacillaceae bacterium]